MKKGKLSARPQLPDVPVDRVQQLARLLATGAELDQIRVTLTRGGWTEGDFRNALAVVEARSFEELCNDNLNLSRAVMRLNRIYDVAIEKGDVRNAYSAQNEINRLLCLHDVRPWEQEKGAQR